MENVSVSVKEPSILALVQPAVLAKPSSEIGVTDLDNLGRGEF
ncbi:hypothetical protein OK016_23385 [Vibrio chagasii]|nr:hypothetical protein [Vibrio chagasii]